MELWNIIYQWNYYNSIYQWNYFMELCSWNSVLWCSWNYGVHIIYHGIMEYNLSMELL